MTIGGINMEKYAMEDADLIYHNLNQKMTQWWTLSFKGLSFGSNEINIGDGSLEN